MERTQAHRQESGPTGAHGLFNAEGDGHQALARDREALDEPGSREGRYETRLARLMRLLNR